MCLYEHSIGNISRAYTREIRQANTDIYMLLTNHHSNHFSDGENLKTDHL